MAGKRNQNKPNTPKSNKQQQKSIKQETSYFKELNKQAEEALKNVQKLSQAMQQFNSTQDSNLENLRARAKLEKQIKEQQETYIQLQKRMNEYRDAGILGKQEILNKREAELRQRIKELEDLRNADSQKRLTRAQREEIQLSYKELSGVKSQKETISKRLREDKDLQKEAMIEALTAYKADKEGEEKDPEQEGQEIGGTIGSIVGSLIPGIGPAAGEAIGSVIGGTLGKVSETLGKIKSVLDDQVEKAIDIIGEFQGTVDSRLQGLDTSFLKMVDRYNQTLSTQGLVKSVDYLENISSLTEKGIAYNLEERALISSIGDRLVSTFEVTNENLLRLIRLQQADMTYSQAGAEAQLTQLLNSVFQDTSYLTDMYDSVSAALIDASSTMTRDQATSFNYAVQKWLGALYSVGLSQSAVDTIAQGINYLATGDVSALTGNTQLNTLMAMSASRAGLSYSQMLSTGLTFENVDSLMTAMVQYLQDIANNTSNQVTKQAFTDVLNLTMSDLRAVSNLTTTDIASLQNNNITWSSAMSQFENQLNQLSSRTNVALQMDNLLENILFNFGTNVANDGWQAFSWKASSLLTDIQEMFGLDAGISGFIIDSVSNILGGGSMIWGLLETVVDVVGSIGNFLGVDDATSYMALLPEDWEYTSRGGGFAGIDELSAASGNLDALTTSLSDVTSGISSSGTISATKNTATESDLLSFEQYANATTVSSVTRGSSDSIRVSRTVSDVYAQLFENKQQVRVSVASIESQARESITNAVTYSIDNGEEDSLVQTTRDIKKFLEDNVSTENITSILSNTIVNVRKQ